MINLGSACNLFDHVTGHEGKLLDLHFICLDLKPCSVVSNNVLKSLTLAELYLHLKNPSFPNLSPALFVATLGYLCQQVLVARLRQVGGAPDQRRRR